MATRCLILLIAAIHLTVLAAAPADGDSSVSTPDSIPSHSTQFQTQPTTTAPTERTRSPTDSQQDSIRYSPGINCSSSNTGGFDLPCHPGGCFMRDIPASHGSTDPCFSGNHHIVIGGDYSLYNMSAEKTTHKIPVNQWFLPKDLSGRCQNVLVKNTSDLCVIPGFCRSPYPWYINLGRASPPKTFGEEVDSSLCMTDITNRNTAVCCAQSHPLTIRSCGFYFVYKLEAASTPSAIAGSLCADSDHDDIKTELMTNMIKLSDRHVIEHGRTIPKNLNQLNKSEGSNLATAKFKLILPRQVQLRELIHRFKLELVSQLNDYAKRRVKREGQSAIIPLLTTTNIKSVIGSPQIQKSGTEQFLYYTFYVQSDRGIVTDQQVVVRGSQRIDNANLSRYYAYMISTVPGVPSDISYPSLNITTSSSSPETGGDNLAPESSGEWRIIVYIVIITTVVIVISLLAVGVYRITLVKSLRLNRGRHLSKLEKWILCETNREEDTPIPLKYLSSNKLITTSSKLSDEAPKNNNAPSCNGNGHIAQEKTTPGHNEIHS